MTRRSASPLGSAACALLAVPFALRAQQGPTQSAPTYTAAQAAAGKTAYDASCASCHGGNLDDGALAPALKGVGFVQKYGGKSVENLFAKVASMPPASPNSLGAADHRAHHRVSAAGQRHRRRHERAAVRSARRWRG